MSEPLYRISIGVVKEIKPYTHMYKVEEFLQVSDKTGTGTCIDAVPLGSRGNTLQGVHTQYSYEIGDKVLFVYQSQDDGPNVTNLGFILGVLTTKPIVSDNQVAGTSWDGGGNINIKNFPKFDQWAQTGGDTRVPTNVGHTGIDMLPGAYELVGRLVAFQFSDYYASLKATCAEISVNGIDRRLVLQSMLRTESTVNSLSDISILNESTIDTHKWCGNVRDSWYNCLGEDEKEISQIPDVTPKYRIIEQSGDILYGKHTTLLDQSGQIPLYADYLGLDGTKKILSASRVIIGKYPGMFATEYVGDRLNVEEHKDEDPTPEQIDDSIANLDVGSSNWQVYANLEFINNNGYPEDFVNGNLGEYPEETPQQIADNLRTGKKIKVFPGNSYIEFQDDGSIKLTDAWGSFILLSHGNIELHAVNNLFGVSGRDTLMFAGGNRTDFAKKDIAIQAYKGSLKAVSDTGLFFKSNNDINLEADDDIHITSDETSIISPTVSISCSSAKLASASVPGKFQLDVPTGTVDIMGTHFRANAQQLSLTSEKTALVVSDLGVTTTGLLDVRGGIQSTKSDLKISIPGQAAPKKFSPSEDMGWTNAGGGLRVNGMIAANADLYVAGNVTGKELVVTIWHKGGPRTLKEESIRRTTRISVEAPKVSAGPTWSGVARDEFDSYAFKFNPTTVKTTYRLVNPLPTHNKSDIVYTGYTDYKNDVSYIYPGREFWVNGVLNLASGKTIGFANMPTAKI